MLQTWWTTCDRHWLWYDAPQNKEGHAGRMVMDAGDLQNGFRLGDWLVEPRLGRMSGQGRSHTLTTQQLAILTALAARRGEVIARAVLREQAWPGQPVTDDVLRATVRELRQLLGDSPKDLRYI